MSSTLVHKVDGVVAWTSGMNIDADGSPRAYAPPTGLVGLDYLANAGKPGDWYGLVTKDGKPTGTPVIQGRNDPACGFYVSATAYGDHSKALTDPTRYVDSETVPYISVPRDMIGHGVSLGDLSLVLYRGRRVAAVVADDGPRNKYGEASIATAKALGIPSNPKKGGTDSGVTYAIFTGTSMPWPRKVSDFTAQLEAALAAWGGQERLTQVMASPV